MLNCPRAILGAFTIAAGMFFFCHAGGWSAAQPAKDHEFNTIVLRTIRPLDDPSSQKRSFAASYGLTSSDFDRCKLLPGVKHLVPLRIFQQEVRNEKKLIDARVVATTEGYALHHRVEMAAGRFLNGKEDEPAIEDKDNFRNVIVLGAGVAKTLFPSDGPKNVVGKTVVLNKHQFEVVGVVKERLPRKDLGPAEKFDHDVYLPIATVRARFGEKIIIRTSGARSSEQVELHEIIITVSDARRALPLAQEIRELLKKHHQKQDWQVTLQKR